MMGFSSNCHYVSAKVPPLNLRTTYSTQCLWQEISHFPEPSNFCSNVISGRVGVLTDGMNQQNCVCVYVLALSWPFSFVETACELCKFSLPGGKIK